MPPGCLALALLLALLALVPLFLADALLLALSKLGLSPGASLLVAFGLLAGGLVNVPIWRIPREELVPVARPGLFGLERLGAGGFALERRHTVIAVNVGGCLVPCALAAYEIGLLAGAGAWPLAAAGLATAANTAACYAVARPVQGVGIAMPPLVPALVAALSALVLLPELAPAVAFTAGVLGPLVGADLLHLREVGRSPTGVASIGGAGTFDGIVLSGLVATLLA